MASLAGMTAGAADLADRRILLLHGPNLNLLGTREPEHYGSLTLAQIEELTTARAAEYGLSVRCLQSNHEGDLVDAVHAAREDCAGIIVNPGAYAHTSISLRDAIAAVSLPAVEVHLSNVFAREPFRHHSYVSEVARVVICGAREHGYELGVAALARLVT